MSQSRRLRLVRKGELISVFTKNEVGSQGSSIKALANTATTPREKHGLGYSTQRSRLKLECPGTFLTSFIYSKHHVTKND